MAFDIDLSVGQGIWLGIVAVVAGLIRGFSGFGTALLYVPLASLVLPPIWVLLTLTVMDMIGPLPNVPRALREGRPSQVALLALGALAGLLPGLWLLDRLTPDLFRWIASGLCLTTVAIMALGWRWRGPMTPPMIGGVGVLAGGLGGTVGLPGPPVILTYMAAPLPVTAIRANILLFLVTWDVLFAGVLALQGRMALEAVLLGAALIPPYLLANVVGARLFVPSRERLYRMVAFGLIGAAAVAALPVWS